MFSTFVVVINVGRVSAGVPLPIDSNKTSSEWSIVTILSPMSSPDQTRPERQPQSGKSESFRRSGRGRERLGRGRTVYAAGGPERTFTALVRDGGDAIEYLSARAVGGDAQLLLQHLHVQLLQQYAARDVILCKIDFCAGPEMTMMKKKKKCQRFVSWGELPGGWACVLYWG